MSLGVELQSPAPSSTDKRNVRTVPKVKEDRLNNLTNGITLKLMRSLRLALLPLVYVKTDEKNPLLASSGLNLEGFLADWEKKCIFRFSCRKSL